MKIYKRIISSVFATVTCFSLCLDTVRAAWQNDLGYWYVNSQLATWAVSSVLSAGGAAIGGAAGSITLPILGSVEGTVWGATAGVALSKGIYDIASYYAAGYIDDDFYDAEEDYVSTLDSTYVSSNASWVYFPRGWSMTAGSYGDFFNQSAMSDESGGYRVSGISLQDSSSGWKLFTAYSEPFELPKGAYSLHYDGKSMCAHDGYTDRRDYVYLYGSDDGINWYDVCSTGYSTSYNNHSSVNARDNRYSKNFSTVSYSYKYYRVSFGQTGLVKVGKSYDFWAHCHIECLEFAEGGINRPDSSSRSSDLMEMISDYNKTNSYLNNPNAVNYYIGTVNDDGSVDKFFEPGVFDEQTMIFTEPESGKTYQAIEWDYNYETRTYGIGFEDGVLSIDGQAANIVLYTLGDDACVLSYYNGETLVKQVSYSYLMVSQNACNINGHTNTVETTKEATCTAPGERLTTCSVCGHQTVEDIPLLERPQP